MSLILFQWFEFSNETLRAITELYTNASLLMILSYVNSYLIVYICKK